MKEKETKSVQEWLPFKKILENGILWMKDSSYIKILKVQPINYNLKSELEKQAILNSYKIFLKTCNFDFQILIQSSKENLSSHILKIKEQIQTEQNSNILEIANQYFEFIQTLNLEKKSSSKSFYIILKQIPEKMKEEQEISMENIEVSSLNDQYFKVKECLARCGNIVREVGSKKDVIEVLYSFYNTRKKNKNE